MKTKYCNGCKTIKPVSDFYKRSDRKNGYQSRCKKCKDKEHSEWVESNLSRKQISQKQWRIKNSKSSWCNHTLNSHSKGQYSGRKSFNVVITKTELLNYISNIDYCELCGKPLSFLNSKTMHNSPSLDRINNEDIITKDNIQLLCHECNSTKRGRTKTEFFNYCLHILRRNGYDV